MEKLDGLVAELIKGVARMEADLRKHAAILRVLQVSTAVLLGGEHAPEALKTLDAEVQKILQADSNALEPATVEAMIDALKNRTFGRS